MKMTHFLVCIGFIALFASGNAKESEYDAEAIKRGDAYIDNLLKDMLEDGVEEYDPYIIEDSVIGFSKKIAFVNISGEAKLHSGFIKGLKTLHRPNHCSLEEENGQLNVKAVLGAGVLDFYYSGSVRFMNFGPTITIQATLSYLETHMEFSVNKETGREGTLNKFQIDDMRGMKAWVTGLGPLNWALNPIIRGVTVIFKRLVRNLIERKVKNHIANKIPNFQFPVEGGIETEATEVTSSPVTTQELTSETAEQTSESRELEVSDVTELTTQEQTSESREPEVSDVTELTTQEQTSESREPEVGDVTESTETASEGNVSDELQTIEETTEETVSEGLETIDEITELTASDEYDVTGETVSEDFETTEEPAEEMVSELKISEEAIATEKEAMGPFKTEAANLVSEKEEKLDVREEPVGKTADETEMSEEIA